MKWRVIERFDNGDELVYEFRNRFDLNEYLDMADGWNFDLEEIDDDEK